MIPTVANVYTAARGVLGDTQVSAGTVFVDSILQPHYQAAYAELYRALNNVQSLLLQREAYWNMPPNTGYLNPATAGISNLGQPVLVEERGSVTTWAISAITPSPSTAIATVTSAVNTLSTGSQPVVFGVGGITDDINDIWTVTVLSPTQFTLNGCTAFGTYTASTGSVSVGTENFAECKPRGRIQNIPNTPGQVFGVYAWEFGRFRFPPCSVLRQLRITYKLSGSAPTITTASVGIDDCETFLAYRTAALAGRSKGMAQRAQAYTITAVGPQWESEGLAGGLLGQMLDGAVRDLQRLPGEDLRAEPYGGNGQLRRNQWIL